MAKSIIVIGSGAAGMTAASTAKEKDPECNVTVFTEDEDIAYSPCAIPWGIEGKSAWTDIVMHTPDFYEKERGIKVFTKTKVESVDDAAKTVTVRTQNIHAVTEGFADMQHHGIPELLCKVKLFRKPFSLILTGG